jgi:DNA-directed RNA polymerase specialized sigma24 family protein
MRDENNLAREHLHLVEHAAKKYRAKLPPRWRMDQEEAEGLALEALVRAIRAWDGVRPFQPYAWTCMKNAIQKRNGQIAKSMEGVTLVSLDAVGDDGMTLHEKIDASCVAGYAPPASEHDRSFALDAMQSAEMPDLWRDVLEAHLAGESWASIGRAHGFSRARAHEIGKLAMGRVGAPRPRSRRGRARTS